VSEPTTGRSWREDWAHFPDDPQAHIGWAHHGLSLTAAGELVAFHPGDSTLLVFSPDGELVRSASCPVREAHGIVVVAEDDVESVWLADPGVKAVRQADGTYQGTHGPAGGQVLRVSFDGEVLQKLDRPPLPSYVDGPYHPTAVAVDERRFGGSGDIWVGDGYGQSLVHRYAADGTHLGVLSGVEGAGQFSCPHAVFIDRRKAEPEVYIADRGNARVQVYGLDGTYRRSFGDGFLNSPSSFAVAGDRLVIAELFARLAVVDADDEFVEYLGENLAAKQRPGWPNALAEDGTTTAPEVQAGRFNSPHGLAVDPGSGAVYVSEWLVGGRLVRLG
jgi:hypothetical protein